MFSKRPFFSFLRSLSKQSLFSKKGEHSLTFLNAAQFLGVLNDNIFKLLMVFLLIDTLGKNYASSILSAAGAIYVVPFLLFSSSAGILADRVSKQKLMVILKGAEVFIMLLSILAFLTKSLWGCYSLLFLLATHSAMFGPSKYGILPELVPKDQVSKANGLITSFTYLAIILGTFLASFITEITDRSFVITAIFCLFIAIAGFISTFGIKKTSPQGSTKKINFLFLTEIRQTLSFTKTIPHLLPAILGSAFFLFVGAFTQLNIIPFALQSLNLSEVAGGYLFLVTSLGIAFGSYISGKIAKKKLELGLSCLIGGALSFFFVLLSVCSFSLTLSVIALVGLGLAGGLFIIPFDTFIQLSSPIEKRGQVIAATNFLSFVGVLIASISLYIFSQILDLSPALGFAVVGVITFAVVFILTLRLSELTFPYFTRKLLFPFHKAKVHLKEPLPASALFIIEGSNRTKALLALGAVPGLHFLLPKTESTKVPFWYKWIRGLDILPIKDQEQVIELAKQSLAKFSYPCLLLKETLLLHTVKTPSFFRDLFTRNKEKVFVITFEKDLQEDSLTICISRYQQNP